MGGGGVITFYVPCCIDPCLLIHSFFQSYFLQPFFSLSSKTQNCPFFSNSHCFFPICFSNCCVARTQICNVLVNMTNDFTVTILKTFLNITKHYWQCHCPLSIVHCPLSIVHCPLSIVHCPLP